MIEARNEGRSTLGVRGSFGTTYDSDGNPASLTYPDGRVLNYTYSARSQLKTVTPAAAVAVAVATYSLQRHRRADAGP